MVVLLRLVVVDVTLVVVLVVEVRDVVVLLMLVVVEVTLVVDVVVGTKSLLQKNKPVK